MTKIIDAHTHIYPAAIADKATKAIGAFYGVEMKHIGTSSILLEEMKKAGISKSLVCSCATTEHQVSSINDMFYAESLAHKEDVYKRQGDMKVEEIYDMLAYLNAPKAIMNKPPSAALFEGQTDEKDMGVTYKEIDAYLRGEKISEESRRIIENYHNSTQHKRMQPPVYENN